MTLTAPRESRKTMSKKQRHRQNQQEPQLSVKSKARRLAELERSHEDDLEANYSTDNTFSHSGDEDYDDCDTSVSSVGGSKVLPAQDEAPLGDLNDCIASIEEYKRKNPSGRAAFLAKYAHILRSYYVGDEIAASFPSIRRVLAKLLVSDNPSEQLLALRSLGLSLLSCPTPGVYEELRSSLMRLCQDEDTEEAVKSQALVVLGVAVIFGRGQDEGRTEVLEFLNEAIESDGSSVGATDSADVVSAALRAWAFVASYQDDLEDLAVAAMDSFMEQMQSTDVEVQTSAAANIAFVFEASRNAAKEGGREFNIRYDPKDIVQDMKAMCQMSKSLLGRKSGREMNMKLNSVITGLELGHGPNYSTAGRPMRNPHTGVGKTKVQDEFVEFGYRDKIPLGGDEYLPIDSWALAAKTTILRSLLISDPNMATHLTENPELREDMLSGWESDDEDAE